jgi:hypothetical protein
MFFPTDSVTAWLGRGIVWTLSFELLLVALSPFELALWNTHRGERISRRVEAKRALLDHHSPKRRIGRRAALATAALAIPLALIAVGVGSHIPTGHTATPEQVTQVTRVVRVVKPVRVQRVVKIRTVAQPVPAQVVSSAPSSSVANPPAKAPVHSSKPTTQKRSSSAPSSPQAHVNLPSTAPTTPSTPSGTGSPSGTQTQAAQPTAGPSGAAAQPTT